MKVGNYVRFDYHRVSTPIQITKVTENHYDSEDDSICYSTDIGLVIDESNLVKEPSSNITDLIEVGDYVNGSLVRKISKQTGTIFCELGHITKENYSGIYSIVTKEQFENMEYKVGDYFER